MTVCTVRVPATTANLGSGFDAVGMALDLFSDFSFDTSGCGLRIEAQGVGAAQLPTDEGNLVFRAFSSTCLWLGAEVPRDLHLSIHNRIALGGGLGSSAAAIVAGVVGAFHVTGAELDPRRLLDCAAALENHPDNIAPALFGGVVVGALQAGHVHCLRFAPPPMLTAVIATPQFHVATDESRARLPASISLADAVFNLSRCGLLVGALLAGRLDLLAAATEDRLHQDLRLTRIPGGIQALQAARQAGAVAAVLSGSGPTVLALLDRRTGSVEAVLAAIEQAFALAGVSVVAHAIEPTCAGAVAWCDMEAGPRE